MIPFILGVAVGIGLSIGALILAYRLSAKPVDNSVDEHGQVLGIGGASFDHGERQ